LLDRIKSRHISSDQPGAFADWLDTEPEVPEGKWFKRFAGMTVCGHSSTLDKFQRGRKSFNSSDGKLACLPRRSWAKAASSSLTIQCINSRDSVWVEEKPLSSP